jgi:hypothetical protein
MKTSISAPRSIFSVAIASILALCSFTIAAQDLSPKVTRSSNLQIVPLELHTASDFTSPAHGIRESSPEEIQRIEQVNNRFAPPRHNASGSSLWDLFPVAFAAQELCKPLLLLGDACLNANLISLAHTHLDSRYPIPPPLTLS